MKNIKEIKERIEDIEATVKDLVGRDNTIEMDKLLVKLETLDWVLGNVRVFMKAKDYWHPKDGDL